MAQLDKSICYCTNLRRIAGIITEFYDDALQDAGVTIAQYYLLIHLSRLGTANITHWAAHVGLDRSTMVRNIKPLQARQWIEAVEGRGKTFTLSPEGKRVLARAIPLWQDAQRRMETVLGQPDAEAVFRIAEKLYALRA